MRAREVRLDYLLGREVTSEGRRIGRIEEFRASGEGATRAIDEYVIGAAGLLERLGVGLRLVVGSHGSGFVARWDQLDISEPEHPRLTCPLEDLKKLV